MKLCFISPYPNTICGIADYTYFLTKALVKINSKIDIHVIAESEGMSDDSRIKVYPVFDRKYFDPKPVIEVLNRLEPDIVHIQHSFSIYGSDERLINVMKFARSIDSKIVITFHSVHSRETADKTVMGCDIEEYNRLLCSYADHVIVHSRSMKNVLVRQGVSEEKISVLRIGVFKLSYIDTLEARKKLGLPLDKKLLMILGFLSPGKGTHIAIKLCKELAKYTRDFRLVIAGWIHPKGSFKQEHAGYIKNCLELIKKYGVNKYVIIVGHYLSRDELPLYVSAADVIICPYVQKQWSSSGVIKLAMGAMKPFVVTRIPKFEEVSEEISDEIVIPYDDVDRMARITYRLLYDKPFRNFILSRIKQYSEKISWEKVAKKHLDIYYRLITNNKP